MTRRQVGRHVPSISISERSDIAFGTIVNRQPSLATSPTPWFSPYINLLPEAPDDRDRSDAPSGTASANTSDDVSSALRGCRILVVDDNQDGADSLALMLELMGAATSVAYDGEVALQQFDHFQPHVVLLDITLPGMTGEDVARTIRQRGNGEVVIVAVTGWGREQDRARSLDAGCDHHLVKPVDIRMLQTLLTSDPRVSQR